MPAYSRILLPWDSQPRELAGVDWENPFTRGLVAAGNHAFPNIDIVSGNVGTNTRTIGVGPAGRNTTTSGLVTFADSDLIKSATGDNSRSVLFVLATTTTSNTVIAEKGSNENFVAQTFSSKFNWRAAGSSVNSISTTSNITSGLPVVVAGTYAKTSYAQKVYFNGAMEASNTGIVDVSNTSPLVFGARVGNVAPFPGQLYLAAIWNRVLSDAEIAELSRNPWQLFAPQSIWVPVSAAAGGATSLTIQDATHGHTADSPTITVASTLAIQDATHAHTADGLTISLGYVDLAIADATHAHTADNLTLSVSGATDLTIQDATHGHSADNLALTLGYVDLLIQEALHAHAADNLDLTVDGSTDLVIDDALHAHTADSLTLTVPQIEGGQVYGGKKRRGPVDDLTIDHVRKQWEYLEEKAAREAPAAPVVKAPTPAPIPATAPAKVAAGVLATPLPASIKLTNPRGQIVTAQDIAAMAQGLERQRIELEVVVTRARRAAEDALILALLND